MILQGNQRGGAKDLALHLLKEENDHVEVHELRGFVSDNLVSALNEAYAVSKGTRAKQFLFSLSLNPPADKEVSTASFENAIARVERKLNLTGQPRAIVFHEKNGRRHCHAVWSRTDAQAMKAIPLPHTKRKLMAISRELYLEHGWQMPKGFIQSEERDPRNFNLAQWQQAKRIGKDPRIIKQVFQDCWALSDNRSSFEQALKARGYTLARGNRRSFVALDHRCEVFAVSKWTGLKTKDIRAKLGDEGSLWAIEKAREHVAKDMHKRLHTLSERQDKTIQARLYDLGTHHKQLVAEQKRERQELVEAQKQRRDAETRLRQERYNNGIRGLLDRLTGRHKRIRKQNERETTQCRLRDRREKDALIFTQQGQRQTLQKRLDRLNRYKDQKHEAISHDMKQYQEIIDLKREVFDLRESQNHRKPDLKP